MRFLRSGAFDVFLVLWTLVLAIPIPWLALQRDPKQVRLVSRIWSRGVVWALAGIVNLRHREIGLENKPAGPALYVCNHQSQWETLVFNELVPDTAIVLKEELYRYPIFGWYLSRSPMIAIDRDAGPSALKKIVREGRQAQADGRSLLIFPEGTRKRVDEPIVFQRGVLMLHKAVSLPVVPVAINAGLFWPRNREIRKPGLITVSYLPPIPPGLSDEEFMRTLETVIGNEKARLVSEARS